MARQHNAVIENAIHRNDYIHTVALSVFNDKIAFAVSEYLWCNAVVN